MRALVALKINENGAEFFMIWGLKMEKENYNFIFLNQNTGDYEIFPKIKNNL